MAQEHLVILTDENVANEVSQQLKNKGVKAERLIDVLSAGTPDPEVLEFAHENGYTLLTHDESIIKHISDRAADGKDHAGLFIAPNHLQGAKGIGKIVTALVKLDAEIKEGSKTIAQNVYNQIKYL